MTLGMSKGDADGAGPRGGNVGKKMKSNSGWYNNGNGTNSSGFSALPGGRPRQQWVRSTPLATTAADGQVRSAQARSRGTGTCTTTTT